MKTVVTVKNLSVRLNGTTVLEDICFDVPAGEITGIIGPNGAGKTTLLRTLLGMVPTWQGEVQIMGRPLARITEVRDKIGYMPQRQSFERHFPLSASDVVSTGLLSPETMLRRTPGRQNCIDAALQDVGMERYASLPFRELSGGEQQRILLARSLVRKPDLLLLDEPNSGLDFPSQQQFFTLLRRLKEERNLTVLLVSHDLVSVSAAVDTLMCINRTMHIHGRPGEVLKSSRLMEAYRCQFDLIRTAADEEEKP